jgi:ribulose-5-phosphate 4-epimerase/fuculose-1-phosphate aldolase
VLNQCSRVHDMRYQACSDVQAHVCVHVHVRDALTLSMNERTTRTRSTRVVRTHTFLMQVCSEQQCMYVGAQA